MKIDSIREKKQLMITQIRRKQHQAIFRQLRYDALASIEVADALTHFLKTQPSQIPEICLQKFKYINMDIFEPFLSLVINNELQYVRDKNLGKINGWFFDCISVINLKFMTSYCKAGTQHILPGYFHATIQAYRPLYSFYLDHVKRIESTQCLVSLNQGQTQESGYIKFMESLEGTQAIIAVLGFWGAYLQHASDYILIENFIIILKLFHLFAEYSSIFVYRETFIFIKNINKYIIKMKILDQNNKNFILNLPLIRDCTIYLNMLKQRMPFVIQKAVDYRLFFYELGQILVTFYSLNSFIPSIFYDSLGLPEHLASFLLGLLQTQEEDFRLCRLSAFKIINYLHANTKSYFYLQGALNITRVISHKVLFEKEQPSTAIILYNLICDDHKKDYKKIMETIEYKQLLDNVTEEQSVDIFELIVKIMHTYEQNEIIYETLLRQCNLEETLRHFYKGKENQKGYQLFVSLVLRNISFFLERYRGVVFDVYKHINQMDFEGQVGLKKTIEDCSELIKSEQILRLQAI